MIDLAGRGAVVTGGGRGIGAAIARALGEAGAAVAVSARTVSEIEEIASELRGSGHKAVAIPCDVTDPESIKRTEFAVQCRIDTQVEVDYYRNGGVLQTVLRKLAAN